LKKKTFKDPHSSVFVGADGNESVIIADCPVFELPQCLIEL